MHVLMITVRSGSVHIEAMQSGRSIQQVLFSTRPRASTTLAYAWPYQQVIRRACL